MSMSVKSPSLLSFTTRITKIIQSQTLASAVLKCHNELGFPSLCLFCSALCVETKTRSKTEVNGKQVAEQRLSHSAVHRNKVHNINKILFTLSRRKNTRRENIFKDERDSNTPICTHKWTSYKTEKLRLQHRGGRRCHYFTMATFT